MSRRLIIIGGRKRRDLALVGTLVIGRDPMCDVSESDPLLSRQHAEFVAGAKNVTVRDLGSRNGILVNGVKRPQAVLHGGDVVQVGHLQVKFIDEAAPALDWAEIASEETVAAPPDVPDIPTLIADPATVRLPHGAPASSGTDRAVERTPVPVCAREPDGAFPIACAPPHDDPDRNDPDHTAPTVRRHGSPAASVPDVQTFVGPGNEIRFEMPKRDWQAVSGGAAAIVSLVHRDGQASMVVERAARAGTFAPGEVSDRFAEHEKETVRALQPVAAGVEARLVALGTRRLAVVTYSREGVAGPERVRQYSIPAGSGLYRLTCSAATPQFAYFEPVFAHVAATFATGTTS